MLENVAFSLTDLPFSWDTTPVFAFPGCHHGFINESEIIEYNLTQFSQFIIWGINVSCQAILNNETYIYPANISGSHYSCINNSYYPNLEPNLEQQAMKMKQMKSINKNTLIFGYALFDAAQLSYIYQHEFDSLILSNWHLSLTNQGTVNCLNASWHCDPEGPTEFMYNFSNNEVIDYFVENVTMSITNSSFVNGLFLDEVDSQYISCLPNEWQFQWNCTDTELQEIGHSIVNALTNMFKRYQTVYKNNKIFSISLHSNMYNYGDLYWRIRNVLEEYNEMTIRYYEAFSDRNDILTFYNETNYGQGGLAIHAHSYRKTMNPDFVELAAFLIGANNQSWFSYSDGWNVNSNWYQPEYNKSLGKPLNFGNCMLNQTSKATVCQRSFQYCHVTFDMTNYTAVLEWK